MKEGLIKYDFLDVHYTYMSLKKEIDNAYSSVMDSGIYIGGDALTGFEKKFANYCDAQFCIGVASGLDALVLSMRAAGVGVGDQVIVPANTFIATWLAVAQVGAIPVPVDADPVTMNIDVDAVSQAVNEYTRAIIPVHLYGAPVSMSKLRKISSTHNLLLLEDAAQAHGGKDGDRRVGSLGDIAAFSFYPGKNLGAFGDGGAVVTSDPDLAERVRIIGNYGSRSKYYHEVVGYNSRLDPLQAAFLSIKLDILDEWNEHRRQIANIYLERLADVDELTLPAAGEGVSVWHLFVVRYKNRDALREALHSRGVATAIHYPIANHKSGAFAEAFANASFPVTEAICQTCLSLPIGPHLQIRDAEEIASLVKDAINELN